MRFATEHRKVRTVGKNGQVYLGKRYASQQVLVDTSDPNIIVITVIPDNERWLHEPETAAALHAALEGAAATAHRTKNKN